MKNDNKLRIAISGASGKMGKILVKTLIKKEKLVLTAALVKETSQYLGKDIGKIIFNKNIGIFFNHNLNNIINDFDVLIDFTSPKNTLINLSICSKYNKMIVIGTTGFSKSEKEKINDAASKIRIVHSPNFSIGINVLIKIVEKMTKLIGKSNDIEIIEYHHRNKLDAPSGTSLYIGESIAKIMNINFNEYAVYSRKGIFNKRKDKEIGFSSVRAGNIIGEHNVIFANNNESIEIKHKAFNRESFANGAIQAAMWLKNKKNGLYSMKDVLND